MTQLPPTAQDIWEMWIAGIAGIAVGVGILHILMWIFLPPNRAGRNSNRKGYRSMNFPDPAPDRQPTNPFTGQPQKRRPDDARINFHGCARCGATHIDLSCFKFSKPVGPFTHWAQCPSTLEPILVLFKDDEL